MILAGIVAVTVVLLLHRLMQWVLSLRKLPPGPTPLPIIGNVIQMYGDLTKKLLWLRDTYGDVCTIHIGSQPAVFVSSMEAAKEVFVKQSDSSSDRPDDFFNTVINDKTSILASSGDRWLEQRRFALRVLRDLGFGKIDSETKIRNAAQELADEWAKTSGQEVDARDLVRRSVTNVICGLVLGVTYELNDEQLGVLLFKVLQSNNRDLAYPRKKPPAAAKILLEYFTEHNISVRKKEFDGVNVECYIDAYLQHLATLDENDTSSFTTDPRELVSNVLLFFVAGSDTTSQTLTWLLLYHLKAQNLPEESDSGIFKLKRMNMYTSNHRSEKKTFAKPANQKRIVKLCGKFRAFRYMADNPEIQERARAEIWDVIGQEKMVTTKDRLLLPYIDAVLSEVLRLIPVALQAVAHMASDDIHINGHVIPAGASIFPNLYAIARDERYCKDPHTFNPDRFLDAEQLPILREISMPFSLGKRICLGESLARTELFIFAVTILQRFRVKSKGPVSFEPLQGEVLLVAKHSNLIFESVGTTSD